MLKELLLSLPNLERIYCIFENEDKWLSKIVINRDLFKEVYLVLLKNDLLRNRKSIESYYKKYDFNPELCKFILDVFVELELIIIKGNEIEISSNNEKTDLSQSTIYQTYAKEDVIKKIFLYSNTYMLKEWFQNQFYE